MCLPLAVQPGERWDSGYGASVKLFPHDNWFLEGKGAICKKCHHRHSGTSYLEDTGMGELKCAHCCTVGSVYCYYEGGDVAGFNCEHERMKFSAARQGETRAERRFVRCCERLEGTVVADPEGYSKPVNIADTFLVLHYWNRSMERLKVAVARALQVFAGSELVGRLNMKAPRRREKGAPVTWVIQEGMWGDGNVEMSEPDGQGGLVGESEALDQSAGLAERSELPGTPGLGLMWEESIMARVHSAPQASQDGDLSRYITPLGELSVETAEAVYGGNSGGLVHGEEYCGLCGEGRKSDRELVDRLDMKYGYAMPARAALPRSEEYLRELREGISCPLHCRVPEVATRGERIRLKTISEFEAEDRGRLGANRECVCDAFKEYLQKRGFSVEKMSQSGLKTVDGHCIVSTPVLLPELCAFLAREIHNSRGGYLEVEEELIKILGDRGLGDDMEMAVREGSVSLKAHLEKGLNHRPMRRFDVSEQISVIRSGVLFWLVEIIPPRVPRNSEGAPLFPVEEAIREALSIIMPIVIEGSGSDADVRDASPPWLRPFLEAQGPKLSMDSEF